MQTYRALLDGMIVNGVLHSPQIIAAFEKVDRKYFVPDDLKELTYLDRPLPIGEGQTISQPSTVAFMLELLEPHTGQKILDIGSGSGWTTSLLCKIVGEQGSVLGLERIDALVERGHENLSKFGFGKQCRIEKAAEVLGRPGEIFDRILVSASSEEVPTALFTQLNVGGILVIPIKNTIFRFTKLSEEEISKEAYPGFRFVPLVY
jgi:protein-L-isoaspartate(D-aspartate) O-methyltransferase